MRIDYFYEDFGILWVLIVLRFILNKCYDNCYYYGVGVDNNAADDDDDNDDDSIVCYITYSSSVGTIDSQMFRKKITSFVPKYKFLLS